LLHRRCIDQSHLAAPVEPDPDARRVVAHEPRRLAAGLELDEPTQAPRAGVDDGNRISLRQADDERARLAQPQHVVPQRRQFDEALQATRVQAHEGVDEGHRAVLVQRHQPVRIQVHVGARTERARGELLGPVAARGFDLRRAAPRHPPRCRPRAAERAPAGGVFDAQRRNAAGCVGLRRVVEADRNAASADQLRRLREHRHAAAQQRQHGDDQDALHGV
jgi:hypothetical protein